MSPGEEAARKVFRVVVRADELLEALEEFMRAELGNSPAKRLLRAKGLSAAMQRYRDARKEIPR
jgi:hypothetical protein